MYVNGGLLDGHNDTDVALHVGDNITVFVIVVGTVSVIGASDQRLTCVTDFICNEQTRNKVANRYLECSLRTPASLSDDGRILRILLNGTELATINISCK